MNDPLSNTIRKLIQQRDDLIEALEACDEYFDQRSDADHDGISFVPNDEMRLLGIVRDALKGVLRP